MEERANHVEYFRVTDSRSESDSQLYDDSMRRYASRYNEHYLMRYTKGLYDERNMAELDG